jgi:DNA primase
VAAYLWKCIGYYNIILNPKDPAILDKQRQASQGVTLYLSTDGSGTVPLQALEQLLNRKGQVVAAFDDDRAGEEMAWRIAQQLPGVSRMTPAYGKDWNERLVNDGYPDQARPSELDKQTMRSLWQWHQAAKRLGQSAAYLSRITEVARAVLQGEPLSESAKTTMQRDLRGGQRSPQLGL